VLANWSSPTILRGKAREDDQVVLQSGNGITALRPYTGVEVWRYDDQCDVIASTAVADGVLYVPANGTTAVQPDAAGGRPKVLWQSNRLAPITPSALVYGGRVFSIGASGVLGCGEAASGKNLWQLRLLVEDGEKSSSGMFSATPVAAGGHIYVVNEEGMMMVVSAAAEKGQIVSHHDFGEGVLGTPAIASGAMYLRSDKHLWKVAR
jgi:outer membrane protein assembly factor BamB